MNNRLLAQMKQRFTSEVLWLFIGRDKSEEEKYQILLSILKTGLKLGKKNEEFKFFIDTEKMETLYGYPVVCLADIPLKDLHIHAERYGRYAIGFHKGSVINNRFQPVLYINQYSPFFHRFMKLRGEIEAHLEEPNKEFSDKFQELLFLLGSIAKSGDIKANPANNRKLDEFQLNNFYYEREWRSICAWNFGKKDVAVIIIPDEKIPDFIEDRKNPVLKIDESIPVLPFSMIYRL